MDPDPTRQRSRKGCLTCRQKRKKCDESKPICGRCKCGGNCVWPTSPIQKKNGLRSAKTFSRPSRLPRTQLPSLDSRTVDVFTPLAGTLSISVSEDNQPTSDLLLELTDCLTDSASNSFTTQQDPMGLRYGAFIYKSSADTLDDDEEAAFTIAEWLPRTLELLGLYLPLDLPFHDGVLWSSAIDSYFSFHIRYFYEPTRLAVFFGDLVVRHCQVESVRLGTLGMSVLFHSYLDPKLPQVSLRKYATELIEAALTSFRFEISQPHATLDAQLSGISVFAGFYYYLGDPGYTRYIEQGLPIVQRLVGATPISIHNLSGPESMGIRLFAGSDVFTAMATLRPVRLTYDCNVDVLLRNNQQGPGPGDTGCGSEWMYGFPDAFLVLTIQILNLKHKLLPPTERNAQAATIEAALQGWKVWPTSVTNSVIRVQRVGAQEIWRHFMILYLYQAIYKATPSHKVVQHSVRQIIKLASTLRPGHNPDCLLYIPYFLAGTFAILAKHRQFLRNRLMNCGVSPHGSMFADALVDLWEQSPIDEHVDWTSRSPPLVMF